MQRIAVALVLCSLAFFARPNDAHAGFNLGLDLGLDLALEDGAGVGFGLGLNPGFEVTDGLAIELNTGFDRFEQDGVRTRLIPFQIGARYRAELGSITPYGFLHVGLVNVNSKIQGADFFGISLSASVTKLGLNAGGGVEFAVGENTGIGAQLGFSHIFTDGGGFTNINVALVTHFSF